MKKKIKITLAMFVLLIIGFILGSCTINVKAAQDNSIKIWLQNENGNMVTYTVIDETTGVNYIVTSTYSYHGGVAITPRYNADGTLYMSK